MTSANFLRIHGEFVNAGLPFSHSVKRPAEASVIMTQGQQPILSSVPLAANGAPAPGKASLGAPDL